MKILLTNDDGIDAPGLATLEGVAKEFGEIFVVAPKHHCSGCGHQITFTGPLETREHGPRRFSVDGTPADCVRLAMAELVGEVDWVLSGINQGSNLGNDVFLSGTVAAAREATWLGQNAIALSQYHLDKSQSDWDWSAKLAKELLAQYLQRKPQSQKFWNINLPMPLPEHRINVPNVVTCALDPSGVPASYRLENEIYFMNNDYHDRPRIADHDVEVCFGGQISVTEV